MEAFISAFDGSTYDEFVAGNDFPRDPSFRVLSDYEVTLLKVEDEKHGGNAFANDPNFDFSVEWQRFVHEREKKENAVLSPLKVQTQLCSR